MGTLRSHRCFQLALAMAGLTAVVLGYAAWGPFPIQVDDWRWFRVPNPAWEATLPPLGVYAMIGLVALAAWQRAERLTLGWQALVVAALVVLAFAGQVLAAKQLPGGYMESLVALGKPGANRYHAAAREVRELCPVLANYTAWMRGPSHKLAVTHPAGPLAFYWVLNHIFAGREALAHGWVVWLENMLASGMHVRGPDAPQNIVALFADASEAELMGIWLASLILRLAAALAIWPVFAMARAVYGLRAAIAAAALSAVVPSFLLFSPGMDQAFPLLAAAGCWLGWTAGVGRSRWRAGAAGALVSVGLFFSLAFAVVLALAMGLCIAGWLRRDERTERGGLAGLAMAAAVGVAVPAITLYLACGYDSFSVWAACVEANAKFNAQVGRRYWNWMMVNPVEFLVFLGVPVACLFVAGTVAAWREALRSGGWRRADWPTLLLAGILVALNFSGANRGEVGRLWMFLMPGCVITAGAYAEGCWPYRRAVLVTAFVLQAVQATVLKSLLDTVLGMYRELA